MNTMTVLPPDTAYLVGINVFGFSAGTPEPTAIPDTETLPVLCDLSQVTFPLRASLFSVKGG